MECIRCQFSFSAGSGKVLRQYGIDGFQSVTHLRKSDEDKVRLIALISDEISSTTTTEIGLMGHEIPSIWLKLANNLGKPLLISGFYREWSQNGVKSEKMQVEQINKFTEQIERALTQSSKIIIMGDANLCSTKWKDPNFVHKNISTPLLNCLDQNGIKIHDVGNTGIWQITS